MSEILGVGVDLCEIERMRALLDTRFPERFFTTDEAAYIRGKGVHAAQTMAGLWAAKEAVLKALGTGLALSPLEVEITHTASGQPNVRLHGEALRHADGGDVLLSVTHEGGFALAFALWRKNP